MTASTVKSARRVIEIMEYFDRVRRPLSLKEICDHLSYPVSSGATLLKSLVLLGYLEYDRRSRTYLPTMRIAVLGSWVPATLFGEIDMLPMMENLRNRTGETVILGTQSDLFAQYVHVVHSTEPLHYTPSPGIVRPLARSGVGQLLLSALPDADIDLLVRRINIADDQPANRIVLAEVMREVSAIRRQGYAYTRNLVTGGVGLVAILLPVAPFGRRFAIGLGGPVARLDARLEDHVKTLRAAAQTLA
ncbi:IclR family transcriptional regulator [Phenylobacterium sp.]|uniref:IclR family transcriptional regulator n=1 Tax=Phenylobacterium sp. TaxID=1871053 RepID=UPI002732582B|nr:helix-turn-helix domain-containing protein [Phenylobacterium sp.]MDP3855971.1 helix-turn-helix domain-containing protein [Phenylobacterium sp.]